MSASASSQATRDPSFRPLEVLSTQITWLRYFKNMRQTTDSLAGSAPSVTAPVDMHLGHPVPMLDAHHQNHGRLEGLPAEVRRHVLSVLDFECLKALVHASPTFHQQYLHDRRHLLSASLNVTLGSVSLDAFFVQKAQAVESSTPKEETERLERWRERLPHRSSFQLAGLVNEDEALAMVRFYIDVVVPVARYFVNETLGAMRRLDRSACDNSDSETGPSGTEWRRCLRAAYRFQLLCCAAKPGPPVMPTDLVRMTGDTLTRGTNSSIIFCNPEPWEGEELLTFYEFAENVYRDVFNDIAAELRPHNENIKSFQFLTPFAVRNYGEGTTLRGGLQLLRTVLIDLKTEDRELLVAALQRSILQSHIPISRMNGTLSSKHQRYILKHSLKGRERLTKERAPLPFQGDDLDRPTLGWTDMWDGEYCSLFAGCTPNEARRWGYVFWDVDRMNRKGRRHLLREQRTEYWDEDPRDGVA